VTQEGESQSAGADELVSRLELIQERPLAERANAYRAIHDELSRVLEGGDREVSSR